MSNISKDQTDLISESLLPESESQESQESQTENNLESNIKIFEEKTGKSFNDFYEKYLPKLIFYITKICRNEEAAMDYAEDSFITALKKIDTYNSEKARFSTWLFVIARNHVFQNLKKQKRLPTVSMDTSIDEEGTTIKEFLPGDDVETEQEREYYQLINKKAALMKESIEKLKAPYYSVIKMREIQKKSYKDIAAELGEDVIMAFESTGGLQKLPQELCDVYEIVDDNGNIVDEKSWYLIEGNTKKTPFYTEINIDSGNYTIKGKIPRNLSTIKSQIRNGRLKLQEMVEEDFEKLDRLYQ